MDEVKTILPYEQQLLAEADSWCIEDAPRRLEKIQRERIRHYKLVKDLLLDKLDTSVMNVLEVGGGPVPVIELLECKYKSVIDPLTDEYAKYFSVPYHKNIKGENLAAKNHFDLIVCTNALDHVEIPELVVANMIKALKPGGYLALLCAENNAITNPHPAHVHNLVPELIHSYADNFCETVWELNYKNDGYRYGWVNYKGKVGQPAFAMLMRKVVGYGY